MQHKLHKNALLNHNSVIFYSLPALPSLYTPQTTCIHLSCSTQLGKSTNTISQHFSSAVVTVLISVTLGLVLSTSSWEITHVSLTCVGDRAALSSLCVSVASGHKKNYKLTWDQSSSCSLEILGKQSRRRWVEGGSCPVCMAVKYIKGSGGQIIKCCKHSKDPTG